MKIDVNELKDYAVRFRRAIEKSLKTEDYSWDTNFIRFPYGCCTYASDLLQKYLYNNGIETLSVAGVYNNDSHCWLETYDGIVIDITGDQYSSRKGLMHYSIPVYVGRKDEFHSLFKLYPPAAYEEKNDPLGKGKKESDFEIRYAFVMRYM